MDRKGQQLTQNDQNCIFRAKFGRFLDKNSNFYGRNSKFRYSHNRKPPRHLVHISFWSGPKWAKNAIFGPNLAVFGPKILIFMGGSKSFSTHITEYHLSTLFALFLFGHHVGQKCQYLAVFGPKIHFLWGWSKTFGTLILGNQ